MDDQVEVSILLVGDEEVGKSLFLSRVTTPPNTATPPQLRDSDQPFIFDIRFSKQPFRLEFYDTSSPTPWSELTPNVVVLCYDVTRMSTLDNLQAKWHRLLTLTYGPRFHDIPVLVLGLKRDLRAAAVANGSRDVVYPQDGHRAAQDMRCDRYMECSARTGELVAEVFEDVCRTAAMTILKDGQGGKSEGGCVLM